MFEAHVLYFLRRYLGQYVRELSTEALKISVWKGDVVLKDLQLKAEALNALKLPITVKAGFLGSVTLKVPWNRLGKEPVIVILDRVFVLAEPVQDGQLSTKEEKEKWLEAKRQQIEELEVAMLEAKDKGPLTPENIPETTWIGSLIATIIGNLKISVTNVHIRYEDVTSNPGHPFCSGVTLHKLAAVTTDESGAETFVTSGALDRLRKSLQLECLSVYHDSDTEPWVADRQWKDMTPQEWSKMFEPSIQPPDGTATTMVYDHQYLLHPVKGVMRYQRYGKREKREPHVPFQKASMELDEVSITLSEAQYRDGIKLLENTSNYRRRLEYVHYRPLVPVKENCRAWWLYACQAVLQQQRKTWFRFSWEKISHSCHLRRRYVQLYASSWQQGSKVELPEIKTIDEELDIEVILLWRLLAHAKVEGAKLKAADERVKKGSWWPFGRASQGAPNLKPSDQGYEAAAEQFTREEWNKINELLSYQPAQEIVGADAPNMLQTAFDITIKQSLASFSYTNKLVVLCGTFTNLYVGLKSYPMKTVHCDVRLTYYGLSGPEGSLIESVSREGREHALLTSFVHHPLEDWKLSATLSPCHVTVWRRSFDRFSEFVKSGQAASPTVALETAAALQSKLEEVTRRAQEQLQLALTQRRRFSIDLDLDAPKVRIPTTEFMGARSETQLLLDLGHFKLHTACENDPLEGHLEKGSLYTRCYVSGSDISAFFVDGAFLWSDLPRLVSSASVVMEDDKGKGPEYLSSIFPVLDRCGMSIILDQCRVEHPSYPATRVAIQVPRLGLHFSPARYMRLLKLLKSLEGVERQDGLGIPKDVVKSTSWDPAEFAGSANLLLWGGIANIVAEWQTCWIALAGPYLYVLESKNAQNYQRCWSMYGKQVVEIPPHNVGDSQYVIAVCNRGIDAQKVVESSNAIILKLEDDEAKTSWLRYLTLAIYRASAPASLTAEDESTKNSSAFLDPSRQLLLFVAGQLNELCICISGKTSLYKDAGTNEIPLLELQAHGGKVNLLQRPYDMTIAMKLHTLKIEDKLQGPFSECCQYIACSVLMEDEDQEVLLNDFILDDEYENFKDALPDFSGTSYEASPISGEGSHSSFGRETELWKPDPLSILKTEAAMEQLVDRSEVASDFVNVRLIMKQAGSPHYDGCDTQISINMAKLDFFCNRPTVVALIDFGIELSEIMESVDVAAVDTLGYGNDSTEKHVVKGLLGRGKSRVVFHLKMDMESVHIFLNQEDGSQLAMLAQEKFKMDLKVFPGSFSISGTLGNLRVCYMTLGFHHHWGWLCDIRDPTCGSLVELEFQSYNKDDDDFPGYDYSLAGKLSAVRIVFLYKFVQEVTAYFAALATPQSQHVITVVDKVGGLEHLIQQTDLEGSAALKLDLSMDTPTIIMPRCSDSREFMQLDLGHLQLSNKFEWRGGDKGDAGAVHLDVLNAEMSGINMVVGIEGEIGKPMIQEACGLHVKVVRSLRDVFRKVPQVQVDVEIGTLRAVVSDKEYLVITDCAATNVAELPSLPPNFRDPLSSESDDQDAAFKYVKLDEQSSQFSKPNDEQVVSVWTLVWVRVDVQHADLELYIGLDRDSALARVEIIDLWLGYRTSSMLDVDIYLTLPKLLITDLRPGIKPEMRLMFGSMSDVETTEERSSHADENLQQGYSGSVACMTLLMMDLRMKPDSKALVIRMQRPRLLVVVDFLLAITEFIVPSLVTITGQTGIMAVGEDPLMMQKHIRLIEPLYMQQEETVVLSSNQRLFADACGIQEFIYDGSGHTLHLNISSLHGGPVIEPLVIIGPGKKLRFKNVRFKNGLHLHDCIRISPGGCYSVSRDDGVVFDDNVDNEVLSLEDCLSKPASPKRSELQSTPLDNNFMLDLQVISPEFTFYDSTQWPAESSSRRERLLRAKFDFSLMLAVKDDDMWVRSFVKGLSVEGGSGILVLDPLDISAEYVCVQKKTNILVRASDISTRLSFNVLRLVLRLHNDALSKFNFGASILSRCTHFDRIWVNKPGQNTQPEIAFWRPHAPPGYVILNDCATSGSKPPSQAVVAVSNAYHRVKKPLYFELLWCSKKGNIEDGSSKVQEITNGEDCCVWLPIAPAGYVTLGCVVERGCLAPSTSVVHCIRKDLVASAAISDCIFYIAPDERSHKNGCSIWRIENATGSFYFQNSVKPPPKVCNLRDILYEDVINSGDVSRLAGGVSQSRSSGSWNRSPSSTSFEAKSSRASMITAQFEKMWWDRGSDSRRAVSIWRPIPLPGYAIIGDTLVEGLEPPGLSLVLRDDASGRLAKPVRFQQRLFISSKGVEDVCIWFPVAPTGYVALGCIVTKTANFPPLEIVRCVRMDLVNQSSFSKKPMWIHIGNRGSNSCCLWRVENQANTFIARADLKKPPPRLAYSLAETEKPKLGGNLSAEVKIGKLSAMIIDDLGGQMTPLMDTTLTGVNLAAHGSTEAISAVALMSIAASIFNSHLESWEPLIEPFDGIVKYEFYDGTSEATLKVGKRLRVTAANTVNINITSAGLEVLLNATLAWEKETEFEQQAQATLQLMQEEDYNQGFAFENAALETGETERLVVENNLYRNLYLRTNHANIQIISASTTKTVLVPPPTLSNRLADMVERRPPRQFVAVHVIEAKDLYALDDGHCPEFLCALRLVTSKQSSNEARSLPQSARSRCVRPVSVTSSGNGFMASARWNEVFIFEVFPECSTNLEIVVTNQGARSGKGEVVGILSLPIKEEKGQDVSHPSSLWRIISHSIRKEHALPGPQMEFKTYTLKSPRKRSSEAHADKKNEKYGTLTAYLYFFATAENNSPSQDSNKESHLPNFKDINLWFSLSPDGPWDGVRSSLLLGTIPKEIDGHKVAIDITMKQGHKHATFRSFVTLFNRNKMPLEVCICPVDFVNTNEESPKLGDSSATIVIEECFENQRYQTHTGWEYNSLSHFLPTDPGHWSNRDYSKSSQEFLKFDLPLGWIWTSEWTVDKSGDVDHDGWFYGPDFDNLKLESTSRKGSKSASDCVRRRRWVRSRQHVPRSRRNIFGVVQPGLSIALPVNHGGDKEYCVQVRPYVKEPVNSYAWGRVVSQSTSPGTGKANPFVLSQLEKTEQLVSCLALADVNTHCWLTMESDANVLYNEDNLPFYDWKIMVDAPLKLENLLPCNAEYIIWEKLDLKLAKKEHGVVSAAEHIHLCTVDIRKPIYLTWLNQGGWRPDKEAILLYSANVEELPRHFWMFHQETQRKLCVSLEYDFGSSASATKVVRLFVPYWISNVASLPLAYRLVELDSNYNASPDLSWMSKAAKVAKQSGQHTTSGKQLHKVVRSLEAVEDSGGIPIMLSPHFPSPLSPRNEDNLLSPRLGFSVALRESNTFYSGLSFRDFEDSKERVALKAEDEKGHYYKLSVLLDLSSERTKIVHVQPHTLYVNRLGCRLQLRQHNLQHEELLHPNEPAKTFLWWSVLEPEVLKIRLDGYRWSHPFSVSIEGIMHVSLWDELGTKKFIVRTEVRSGGKHSDTLVIFRHVSTHGPYRIENKASGLPFRFRQAGGDNESWQLLSPCSAMSFAWEDLQREKRLEILIDGADPRTSRTYNIDEDADHQPFPTQRGPTASLHVAIFQDGTVKVVKVSDWTPSSSGLELICVGPQSFGSQDIKGADQGHPRNVSNDASGSQFQTVIELADFGISVVDHTPEELLYLSVQNFILSYAVGVGTKTSRLKLRIDRLQLDNQLPVTPMPVIFSPQDNAKQAEFVLKCSITTQDDGVSDHYVYPYIGIQGPSIPNMPFLINIHEPIIWRIHEMLCRANLGQLTSSQSKAVALDPIIHIGILSTSEIRFKVSLAMSPGQRPRGVLGFWSSLLTSLGNTDDMPIRIRPHMQENICMSQSALVAAAVTSIRNDVLSQPLRLLSGVDLLGNASSALGHMSKGVAALSLDKKFIRSRQRQESKGNVEDIGGGIREGGEALAKGLFRGVTGILTKPFEGAKSSGVEGFIQGVGKGVIGAAVQPMSGILDLLSKTTEGANATRMKITAALTSEENLLRHRLPRVISGDNILRPYDEYRAHGQVLLQMAQRSTIFGPMDLFRIRGKFASTDAYEDHFLLPKGRILLITHLRVLLLQQSGNPFGQKRAELFRNPCTICWDILWKDLDRVELNYGKKDIKNSPSHLVFYLRLSSQQLQLESREDVRVVKCHRNTKQAMEIYAAIQRVRSFQSSESGDKIMKRRVLRPYAGSNGTGTPDSPVGLLTPTAGSLMGMSMFSPLAQGIFEPSSRPFDRSPESSSRVDPKGGRFISQFKLIWWNKNEASAEPMSVWRPVPPSGYVAVGHVIQTSYDPPDSAMVYPEAGDGRLAYPQGFQLVWQEAAKASCAALSVYRPLPPQGFVAIGHVCVPGIYEPETDAIKCVRHAFVEATTLNQQPIFRSSNSLRCVFWRLNNNSRTFLAVRDGQSPPSNLAFNVKV